MSFNLSKGFFFFCFDNQVDKSFQPILQVLMMRAAKDYSNVRMKISDGVFVYNSVIATPDAVRDDELNVDNPGNAVIRVNEWAFVPHEQTQMDKPFLKVLRFEILQQNIPVICPEAVIFTGEPSPVRQYVASLGLTAAGMMSPNWTGNKRPRLNNHPSNLPEIVAPPMPPGARKSPGKSNVSNTSRNTTALNRAVQPSDQDAQNNGQQPAEAITPFLYLTPFINKFRICGVCSFKEGVREVRNAARGTMNVFSFNLTDEKGVSLKVTAWNELALETDPMIVEGHTYYIRGNSSALRKKNGKYNTTDLDYELTLNNSTEVFVCADRTIPLPKISIKRVPIASLVPCDVPIDIIGVIDKVNEMTTVMSKAKGELKKREVEIIDDSNAKVNLTLWEEKAEGWIGAAGEILCIRNGLLREFMGGVSISLISTSQVDLNPDMEETQALFAWYNENRPDSKHIASMSTQNSGSNSIEEFRTLEWSENHPSIDDWPNGIAFTARVIIDEVRKENAFYQACTSCNKKVTKVDVGWYCEKCASTTADSETRYMLSVKISDFTGSVYTTVFGQTAADLLGITAAELSKLSEENFDAYCNVFKSVQFSNLCLRLKVRNEYYNDQKRHKYTVQAIKNAHPEVLNKGFDDLLCVLENL